MLAHAFNSASVYQPQSGPTRPPLGRHPVRLGHRGRVRVLPARRDQSPTSRSALGQQSDLAGAHRALDLRRVLAGAGDLAHLRNIRCPVLVVGGWFDAEDLSGPLRVYHAIKDAESRDADDHSSWGRGRTAAGPSIDGRRLGSVDFATDTAAFYREHIIAAVLRAPPEGRTGPGAAGRARLRDGHERLATAIRLAAPRGRAANPLLPRAGRALVRSADGRADAVDSYVSDPAKPVPWVGYTALTMPEEYMVSDQRFAATRPDVLVYATEPLEEDLTMAGPISPKLFVSTTGTDSDWIVKLIDVYPPDRSTPEAADAGEVWSPPVHARGLSAACPRLAAARQVPEELRNPRAVRTRQGRVDRLHDARREPRLPARPPGDDPGPEHVVPAHRPEPADLRGHPDGDGRELPGGNAARRAIERATVRCRGPRTSGTLNQREVKG